MFYEEPFSHGNHHIRFEMHHVYLTQSISARKATHIKSGVCSGSSHCQLHFNTQMVSIGWSGCEWLPSECKSVHFQEILQLAPSDDFLLQYNNNIAPFVSELVDLLLTILGRSAEQSHVTLNLNHSSEMLDSPGRWCPPSQPKTAIRQL